MAHESAPHDQIGPGQGADQRAAEPGEQQHEVVGSEGRHNGLQHNGHRVPEHVPRGGEVQNRAGVPVGVI